MITRIHNLIIEEGISVRKFEQSINASNGLIRKAITNQTDVQSKWILEIASTYPNVNLEWLIKGQGEMYQNNSKENDNAQIYISENEFNKMKMEIESLKSLIESNKVLIESQIEIIKTKNEIIDIKNQVIESLINKNSLVQNK